MPHKHISIIARVQLPSPVHPHISRHYPPKPFQQKTYEGIMKHVHIGIQDRLQIKVQPDNNEKSKRGVGSISQEIDGEVTSFNIGSKGKVNPSDRRRLSIKDVDSK